MAATYLAVQFHSASGAIAAIRRALLQEGVGFAGQLPLLEFSASRIRMKKG
jgi:hypothetical protein